MLATFDVSASMSLHQLVVEPLLIATGKVGVSRRTLTITPQ
jgi:hypothetical protein